ncbi:MAG: hypothetical protein EBV34_18770, partial [Betaproteobacteria bacterium]|nr:hypothetical protein [Betaproteobacteria bacterium]
MAKFLITTLDPRTDTVVPLLYDNMDSSLTDLKGQSVIPGLMDNHLHGAGGGPGVDLSRTRSMADVNAA